MFYPPNLEEDFIGGSKQHEPYEEYQPMFYPPNLEEGSEEKR